MSRALNAATLSNIGNTDLQIFHLITFYFGTPFRLTDFAHDISYDFGLGSETFLATGRLASTSSFEEQSDLTNPSVEITLTGANAADISLALTENFNNEQVVIRRGFFDSSGNTSDANIIAAPFIVFDGRVDSFSIADNPLEGESAVSWKISSHWADWDKIAGRKCNNQNAKLYFPSEEGFSHCYDQIGQKTWGRIRS